VDLLADRERRREVVLDGREVGRAVVAERAVRRDALARDTRGKARARQLSRFGRRDDRARLHEARARDRERRALRERLRLQRIEARIAEALPPRPLGFGVARRRLAPRLFELPRGRHVDGRTHVVGADGAAGERDDDHERGAAARAPRRHGSDFDAAPRLRGALADPSSPPIATATLSPSASESEGLTTSRSPSAMPPSTSIDSPRLRPSVTAFRRTRLAPSTSATRVPSPRKSSTLVGTTSVFAPASGRSTCT